MSKQFTNKMQNQVKEFHEAFGHPLEEKPTLVDIERFTNRGIWNIEEQIELLHALSTDDQEFTKYFKVLMDGVREAYHKQLQKKRPTTEKGKIVAVADAIADGLYFKLGDAVEVGVDIELVMNHVQNSNMSKLFEDEEGKLYAKYREDGKILKSDRFFEPEPKIKEEIEYQLKDIKKEQYVMGIDLSTNDNSEITITQGGCIVGKLEVNDLIPKEVTVNKGEVILNKEDAKNIISQSNKKPSKKIKDSVEKVTSEQVKDVIETVLSNKDTE